MSLQKNNSIRTNHLQGTNLTALRTSNESCYLTFYDVQHTQRCLNHDTYTGVTLKHSNMENNE